MKGLKSIWKLTEGERLRFSLAVSAVLLASGLAYLVPMVAQVAIDGAIARRLSNDGMHEVKGVTGKAIEFLDQTMGASWLVDHLWVAGLTMVMLTVLVGVLMYIRGHLTTYSSERIGRKLRADLFDRLQRAHAKYHDESETGDLIQRCSSDVDTTRMFFSTHLSETLRTLALMVVALPLMFWLDWRMAMASLISMPLILGFSALFFTLAKQKFKANEEAEGKLTTVLQENLEGIRVVRAFSEQASEIQKFDEINRRRQKTHWELYKVFAYFWSGGDVLSMGQLGLTLCLGIYWVRDGQLTVGELYTFMTWVMLYMEPVRQLGRLLSELGRAQVALRRIEEVMEVELEVPEPEGTVKPTPELKGHIQFKDVSYRYNAEADFELKHVNLEIQPGETVAFMGPSGGGKTTILSLLQRLYDGYEGSIKIDGHELKELEKQTLRRQIALVAQQPFLASRSIERNIRLGHMKASDQEMIEVSEAAAIHTSVKTFERAYDTVVGEKGVTLSGGQRQRVVIARALLQKSPMLFLDDALSAVDSRTERHILQAIERKHGDRTTLMVAHRLTTLKPADRIVILEAGRVTDVGTHEALKERKGLYRRLWEAQTALEDELELASTGMDSETGRGKA